MKYITLHVKKVGISNISLLNEVGRGVFNRESLLDFLDKDIDPSNDEIIIDLTKVGWISVYDWFIFTTILYSILETNNNLKISIDFIGNRPSGLISYMESKEVLKGQRRAIDYPKLDYIDSYVIHRVINFVKSLEGEKGFSKFMGKRLVLRGVSEKYAKTPGWYTSNVNNSVILSRTSVTSKEMSKLFLARRKIDDWRIEISKKKVPESEVFRSEEFWRILCHELSRNVYEHAQGPGFITARVVIPKKDSNILPSWCRSVYDNLLYEKIHKFNVKGFLELCVCDAGIGIGNTLKKSYVNNYKRRYIHKELPKEIEEIDLIKFAFDELGTSKNDQSFLVQRHALGHILFLIGKYGGAINIRSGNSELRYFPMNHLKRCKNQLGYEPDYQKIFSTRIIGTHIQIIIPLSPLERRGDSDYHSMHRSTLPKEYFIDEEHPIGPLIPVNDKIEFYNSLEKDKNQEMFLNACENFAKSIIHGKEPAKGVLVFDFEEIDWSLSQFEIFLYKFQNIIVGRSVLFTNFSSDFAKLINNREDNHEPTYIDKEMKIKIKKRRQELELEREFNEAKFLETYSGLGSIILVLGPEDSIFLFGLRNKMIREALINIIKGSPMSIKEISNSYHVEIETVKTVLNASNGLFKRNENGVWESEWQPKEIEIQRQRSISEHFDIVAEKCKAWRGKRSHGTQKDLDEPRFYIPTENSVFSAFFDTSRILERDRYATEVAHRLLYRLNYGLSLQVPSLNLDDVDILACSTTPTVILAESIRRVWPIKGEGKRPIVVDYGPSLFYGTKLSKIKQQTKKSLKAIIIHDIYHSGTLLKKIATKLRGQDIEIIFALSFIKSVDQEMISKNDPKVFKAQSNWKNKHEQVGITIHSMIKLPRPKEITRNQLLDWGTKARDYVVDPRSLKPVLLQSLRLESNFSKERSLTKRDKYLKILDNDNEYCRIVSGHFVYGKRHFATTADVHGILTGKIGANIISWIADICCGYENRQVPWEEGNINSFKGEISCILMPLHSQIHYLLPKLQIELAQRGKRYHHYFLDSTSFGGGVETYEIPRQLREQIKVKTSELKIIKEQKQSHSDYEIIIKKKQIRILILDDAIFSGKTIRTILNCLGKQCNKLIQDYFGTDINDNEHPIEWIRVFTILNQLPTDQSVLWHNLKTCSASQKFRFDEFAPFVGVATYNKYDCPVCRKIEQLDKIIERVKNISDTSAVAWAKEYKEKLLPNTLEVQTFRKGKIGFLPNEIEVLPLSIESAPDRYNPKHVDAAIWRFYELMYLSYPLNDVLQCLEKTREFGRQFPDFRKEYSHFRLAVYNWCIDNWHRVCVYHSQANIKSQIISEVESNERIIPQILLRLPEIFEEDIVKEINIYLIDLLYNSEQGSQNIENHLKLLIDTGLTLELLSVDRNSKNLKEIKEYLSQKCCDIRNKRNILNILNLRLTKPIASPINPSPDPRWAMNTIADICFRGIKRHKTDWRKCKHELLGKLVDQAMRHPNNKIVRHKLEGSIDCFLSSVRILESYTYTDLFLNIKKVAEEVLLLILQKRNKIDDTSLFYKFNKILEREESWNKFENNFHLSIDKMIKKLHYENEINNNVQIKINCQNDIKHWHILTKIPELIFCITNLVFGPGCFENVKILNDLIPTINIRKSNSPHFINIDLCTSYGLSSNAKSNITESSKIYREINVLKLFGVKIEEDFIKIVDDDRIRIRFVIPVGYSPDKKGENT